MARIILVTGGSRSGKSQYAQRLAESIPGVRTYIATCPYLDAEMEERIRKHQASRKASDWEAIEETADIIGALFKAKSSAVILLDCLTLWINNLLYKAQTENHDFLEEDMGMSCRAILEACAQFPGTIIFVTNEVSMGIIPDNPLARHYRDLVGRCNQVMAAEAHQVILMVSGLPVILKDS